jgi:hypothetical protein
MNARTRRPINSAGFTFLGLPALSSLAAAFARAFAGTNLAKMAASLASQGLNHALLERLRQLRRNHLDVILYGQAQSFYPVAQDSPLSLHCYANDEETDGCER